MENIFFTTNILPEKAFAKCMEKYKGDFGRKRFKSREYLVRISFV